MHVMQYKAVSEASSSELVFFESFWRASLFIAKTNMKRHEATLESCEKNVSDHEASGISDSRQIAKAKEWLEREREAKKEMEDLCKNIEMQLDWYESILRDEANSMECNV